MRRYPYWILLAVAVALRLPDLREPLWYDEIWATLAVLRDAGELWHVLVNDMHPPLYPTFMFGWIRLFGDSELAVRIPSLLAGVTTVALMPPLGRQFATPRAGWIAAWLLALSPVHVWFSGEARSYAILMLLAVTVVLLAGMVERRETDPRWRAAYIAATVTITLTHFYGLSVVGLVALWSLTMTPRARQTILLGLGFSVALLGIVWLIRVQMSWLYFPPMHLGALTVGRLPGLARWLLAGSSEGTPLPPYLALHVALGLGLAIAGLVRGVPGASEPRAARWARLRLASAVLWLPAALLVLGFVGVQRYYIERSTLVILPFLMVAVAMGVESLRQRWPRHVASSAVMAGSLLAFATFWVRRDGLTVAWANPDWRAMQPLLDAEFARSPRPTIVMSTTPLDEMLYYRPSSRRCMLPPAGAANPDGVTHACRNEGEDGPGAPHLYWLWVPEIASLRAVLDAEGVSAGLFIAREAWKEKAPELLEAAASSGEWTLTSAGRVRGLELWRVSRREVASREAPNRAPEQRDERPSGALPSAGNSDSSPVPRHPLLDSTRPHLVEEDPMQRWLHELEPLHGRPGAHHAP